MSEDKRHVVKASDRRRRGNTSRTPVVVKTELRWHELPDDVAEKLFELIGEGPYTEDMRAGKIHYTTALIIKE